MNKRNLRQAIVTTYQGKDGNDSPERIEAPLNERKVVDNYNLIDPKSITTQQLHYYLCKINGFGSIKNSDLVDYRTAMQDAKMSRDKESQSCIRWEHQRYGCNLFFWNEIESIYDALQYEDALEL